MLSTLTSPLTIPLDWKMLLSGTPVEMINPRLDDPKVFLE
jgi:hypothetical protein